MDKDLSRCMQLIVLESKGCVIKSYAGGPIGMGLMGLAKSSKFQRNALKPINF